MHWRPGADACLCLPFPCLASVVVKAGILGNESASGKNAAGLPLTLSPQGAQPRSGLCLVPCQVLPDCRGHHTPSFHSGTQLIGRAVQLFGPIGQLVILIDVDALPILRAFVFQVICHGSSWLVDIEGYRVHLVNLNRSAPSAGMQVKPCKIIRIRQICLP